MTVSRTASILALGIIISFARRDAMATPSCELYPIPLRPADGVQAAAQEDLASLSPGAKLFWNNNRGTLRSAFPLAITLPRCTSGEDVTAHVFDMLAAHPALFQLDLAEWRRPAPFDCKNLGSNTTFSMGRTSLAGQPVAQDVFVYLLKRVDDDVLVTFANGTYLPAVSATVGDTMAACSILTPATAAALARKSELNVTVFSQCVRTDTITYTPKLNDSFSLSGALWSWQEDIGQVLLTGERTLRVVVNPANYTPELLSSNARCPVFGGNSNEFVIGFDITFDVNTGAITFVKPGLDCIVC